MRLVTLAALATLVLVSRPSPGDEAEEEAERAVATQPPVQAVRGGTLGLPTPSTQGVSALLNNQVDPAGDYGFSYVAQIGGLELSRYVAIDIFGESLRMAIPRTEVTPGAGVTPLPELTSLGFQSIGVRTTIRFNPASKAELAPQDCVALRAAFHSATAKEKDDAAAGAYPCKDWAACKTQCADYDLDIDSKPSKASNLAAFTAAERRKIRGFNVMFGPRFIFKTPTGDEDPRSVGAAGEVSLQLVQPWGGLFISGVVVHMNAGDDEVDQTRVLDAQVTEAGGTLGGYWQGSQAIGDAELLPTVGGYARLSRNFWTNAFVQDGSPVDPDISGTQLEIGAYFRGHFTSGFAGLFGLALLQPYGRHDDIQVIFSVAPIAGAAL